MNNLKEHIKNAIEFYLFLTVVFITIAALGVTCYGIGFGVAWVLSLTL